MRFLVLSVSDVEKMAFAKWRGKADFVDIKKLTTNKKDARIDAYMSIHPECFEIYDYVLSIENMVMLVSGEYFDYCVCCLFETRSLSYLYRTSKGILAVETNSDDRKTQILTTLNEFDSYIELIETNRRLLKSEIAHDIKNVLPLFAKHKTRLAMHKLVSCMELCPDYVLGVESRGFILGELVASETHAGFIAAQKSAKLHLEVYEESYGTNKLCIEKYDLTHKNVIIVDDFLATGNTILTAARLARRCGASVTFAICITAIPELLPQTRRLLRANGIDILLMF